jgi:hypothetical protein
LSCATAGVAAAAAAAAAPMNTARRTAARTRLLVVIEGFLPRDSSTLFADH